MTKLRDRAKKLIFKKEFLQHKNDSRKAWQLIHFVLPTSKPKRGEAPERTLIDNKEVTEKFAIFETFNQQFISIGKKLADNINSTQKSFYKFLPRRDRTSMNLEPPRYNEVFNNIK